MGTKGTGGSPGEGAWPSADIAALAAQRMPAKGRWLVPATVSASPWGPFTVREIPETGARLASGGVLIRLLPRHGWTPRAEVWAVTDDAVVPVAAWECLRPESWQEVIRPAVVFTMTVLGQLGRAADLSRLDPSPLRQWDEQAGLPPLTWPGTSSERT